MIHDLLTKKKALVDEARAIQTRVYAEQNGEWRGDDDAKFTGLTDQAEKIQQEIEKLARLDAAARDLEQAQESRGRKTEAPAPNQPAYRGQVSEQDRAEALRAWMLGPKASEKQREIARRCGLDVTSGELVLNLFSPVAMRTTSLRSTTPEDVSRWQGEHRAALTGAQSTTTTGGYTVADATMQALEQALLKFGGMRQVATILRTATGGPLPIPTTNDTSQKGRLLSENTGATETEMTFGQLVLDAYKYSSDYVLASVEFLQDSSIDVAGFLGSALGTRIARLQNDHFTTGTGASQPKGIVTAATSSSVTFSGTATVTYDNIVDLIHSVDPSYRDNGRFMFHDGALKMLKKIKVLQYSGDTTGVPLWQPSLTVGQPDMIHGYPYIINQSMTTPATGVKSILFGDFSKYIIRDVREVELMRLNERFAEQHSVAFLAFARSDGDLLDAGTNPVKYGTQA